MRPRFSSVLAFTLATACGPNRVELVGPYPEDTAWVAAVLRDEDGTVVGATGVLPFDPARPFTTRLPETEAAEAVVQTWPAAALASLPPVPLGDPPLPVAAAGAEDPVLPAPAWSGRSRPLGAPLETVAEPLLLTAGWLPACPTVVAEEEELLLDIRCGSLPCPLRFRQQACSLNLPLTACGLPPLAGQIDGRGRIVWTRLDGQPECAPQSPPGGALAAFICDACRVDAYVRSRTPVEPLQPTRLAVAPATTEGSTRPPFPGALRSVALVDPEGLVALAATAEPCAEESDQVEVLALELGPGGALELRRRARHRGCGEARLRSMASGAVLATHTATAVELARLDRLGTSELRVELGPRDGRELLGLALDPRSDRVAVVLARTDARPGRLFLRRLSDLAPVATPDLANGAPVGGLAFLAPDALFVAGDGEIEVFDPDDGRSRGLVAAGTGDGVSNEFHHLVTLPTGRQLGISATSRSGVHVLEGSRALAATIFFPRRAVLTDAVFAPSPSAPGFPTLVAGYACDVMDECATGATPSFLARFSDDEIRFAPFGRDLGRGPILDLQVDDEGGVWAALVAEGVVVRIPPERLDP